MIILSKEQIIGFDWNLLGKVRFEVYGVKDFLRDYGDDQSTCEISKSVQNSEEKEFFISIFIPANESGESALKLLRNIQMHGFYY